MYYTEKKTFKYHNSNSAIHNLKSLRLEVHCDYGRLKVPLRLKGDKSHAPVLAALEHSNAHIPLWRQK